MANLFWKKKTGIALNLVESEFSSEAAFEDYLFKNQQDFLDGIYIFSRQVRTMAGPPLQPRKGQGFRSLESEPRR